MIGISKLYCGTVEASDPVRYGRRSDRLPSHLLQFSADKKPVVVWNATRRCNLTCVHCYASATPGAAPDELTTDEARRMIADLGRFGCPVLLVSGGEPLMRGDVLDVIAAAKAAGLRAVLSTNGTLIRPDLAGRLARAGLSYVGVSLDGLRQVHDRFRGVAGAFDQALAGIRACRAAVELLKMNGGNSSGVGIGCVSWNGDVLPDQFWRHHVLGNVRRRPFSEIWNDPDQPLLARLRDRKARLRCRCLRCRWLDVCNGNFRARAEADTGDLWGDDPACYLTDEEISPAEHLA